MTHSESNTPSNQVVKAKYRGRRGRARDLLGISNEILQSASQKAALEEKKARKRAAAKILALKARAKRAGFTAGLRKADHRCLKKLAEYQKLFDRSAASLKEECLALSFSIAEEIIGNSVKTDKEALANRISSAVAALIDLRDLKIEVSTEEHKEVKKALSRLNVELASKLTPGGELPKGCAVVKSACGEIELDWRRHLSILKQLFDTRNSDYFSTAACTEPE